MPTDVGKVDHYKERIIHYLQNRGPSLPINISQSIGVSTLFGSAFLSELFADRKVKTSSMKVGSSSLYYLDGQEGQLENFIQYLNQREREAFSLLKREKVLEDTKQTPVVRVALRAIKDFAVPLRVRDGEDVRLFWKYFLVNDDEIESLVRKSMDSGLQKTGEIVLKREEKPEVKEEVKELPPEKIEVAKKEEVIEKVIENKVLEEMEKPQKKGKKIIILEDSDFVKAIKRYLETKEGQVGESYLNKKKEFAAKVKFKELFGEQEYYVYAKEKKSIGDSDLAIALHKGQEMKMPCLVLSEGELNSKGREYIKTWGNLVKFARIGLRE